MFLENTKKSGSIEVICGSMFSGKTEELIRRLKRAQFAQQKIATFKPTIDKRYSDLDVVSHDSHSISCMPIKSPSRMLQIDPDVQVVGIDEAQFFDDSIIGVCQELANRGVRVIIAGLDTDYLASPSAPCPALWPSLRMFRRYTPSASVAVPWLITRIVSRPARNWWFWEKKTPMSPCAGTATSRP